MQFTMEKLERVLLGFKPMRVVAVSQLAEDWGSRCSTSTHDPHQGEPSVPSTLASLMVYFVCIRDFLLL